ncbi:diphthine synthase [Candidatus Woesearchaeota archaeon]|jgi:diphthine synthase|nr:diphthine synthase [Candidatus Woesearchaeota archaeon]
MFYLIGLGLDEKDLTNESLKVLKKSSIIYLEDYTVNFPYNLEKFIKNLEKKIKKRIIKANREKVEDLSLIKESENKDVSLLVYGSPLTATTHISLIQEAKKQKIKFKIFYNSSIFDAIAETGLEIYKFGKITSIPRWQSNFKPKSFAEIIKENLSVNAHSLLLIDINLDLNDAIKELKEGLSEYNIKIYNDKIVLCSCLGTEKSKIFYADIENIIKLNSELNNKLNIEKPYCLIIPGKLHFLEKEILEGFEI